MYLRKKEKNDFLWKNRGVCFEDIVLALENGKLLDEHPHENQKEYSHQIILTVDIQNYAWRIPCIIDEQGNYCFITAYPSRVATRNYLSQ